MKLVRKLVTIVLWTLIVAGSAAAQPTASLSGLVSDTSGGRLPGVTVEVLTEGAARPVNTTTTDANGSYLFATLRPGRYVVRFALDGFAKVEKPAIIAAGAALEVTVALGVKNLSETVSVVANEVALAPTNATQGTTFSNATLSQLPTSSRNYTHVIVAEAGVNAPLPDRTGRGLNIATNPGTQAEDASQSLNPSVNGARPTNNALRINGVDATNMLNASGGLGSSVGIPLDALEEVEVQTALPSAARGRNGGGNIELITRSGTDRFSGQRGTLLPAREAERQRVLPQPRRHGQAGIPPQRQRPPRSAARCVRGRTYFFGAAQRQQLQSGYASNATAATGLPTGLTDVRTAETIAAVANEWLRSGAAGQPARSRRTS